MQIKDQYYSKVKSLDFEPLRPFQNDRVRSVLLLTWMCLHAVTRSWALCGGDWYCRSGGQAVNLKKLELRLLQLCKLGLKQALESYPKVFHQCKPAQGKPHDAPAMWQKQLYRVTGTK